MRLVDCCQAFWSGVLVSLIVALCGIAAAFVVLLVTLAVYGLATGILWVWALFLWVVIAGIIGIVVQGCEEKTKNKHE
jgi:hypothetical protein